MYQLRSGRSESIWKTKANSISLITHLIIFGILFYSLLPLSLLPQTLLSQSLNSIYSPGDWVTYLNTRTITSISEGNRYVYFGTTNGIIQYDLLRREWADPVNKSNGLSDDFIYSVA